MTHRAHEQDSGSDDHEGRNDRRFTGKGGYAADEREQTAERERVTRRAVDESGELPSVDADVEGGDRGRAERYED